MTAPQVTVRCQKAICDRSGGVLNSGNVKHPQKRKRMEYIDKSTADMGALEGTQERNRPYFTSETRGVHQLKTNLNTASTLSTHRQYIHRILLVCILKRKSHTYNSPRRAVSVLSQNHNYSNFKRQSLNCNYLVKKNALYIFLNIA